MVLVRDLGAKVPEFDTTKPITGAHAEAMIDKGDGRAVSEIARLVR